MPKFGTEWVDMGCGATAGELIHAFYDIRRMEVLTAYENPTKSKEIG